MPTGNLYCLPIRDTRVARKDDTALNENTHTKPKGGIR